MESMSLDVRKKTLRDNPSLDMFNLCQTDKSWNQACNDKNYWGRALQKDFGWMHGGTFKHYYLFERVIDRLINEMPVNDRYRKALYNVIREDLIPLIVKILDNGKRVIDNPDKLGDDEEDLNDPILIIEHIFNYIDYYQWDIARILLIVKTDIFSEKRYLDRDVLEKTKMKNHIEDLIKDFFDLQY